MDDFHWGECCIVVPFMEESRTQRQFFFQKYYAAFKKLGDKRQKITEVGCGRCTIGQYFARDGKDVECMDISQYAVDLARKNFKDAGLHGTFVRADVLHLPLGKYQRKYRDMIVSVGLIEHLETGEWQNCIKECYRILRPGGMLAFINVPKKFSIQTFFQKHDHYHREKLIPEDYVRVCKEAGFRVVDFFYINPFPLLETRYEKFWTRIYKTIYWIRSLWMEYPMRGSKLFSQAHFLVAIK